MSLRKRRRVGTALVAAAALALLPATGALAEGPPVMNESDHVVSETSTDIDVHPCTGQPAELTIVYDGVIHFSAFADGTVHFTGTLRGTFSADALPTDGVPDASGTFVEWFGGNGALPEDGGAVGKAVGTFTLSGRGSNADGTTFSFHQNGHTVFDANGVPKLDFLKLHASCG